MNAQREYMNMHDHFWMCVVIIVCTWHVFVVVLKIETVMLIFILLK